MPTAKNRRKPIEVKKAQGTLNKSRDNLESPEAVFDERFNVSKIEMKDERARLLFNEILLLLKEFRILSNQDKYLLNILAKELTDYWQLTDLIDEQGWTVSGKFGPIKNPLSSTKNSCWDKIKYITAELGMSPASRQKVKASKQEKDVKETLAKLFDLNA